MAQRIETTAPLVFFASMLALSFGAFSWHTKQEIKKRAGYASELTGKSEDDGYCLEAAHLNHNRTYPDYDNPLNGLLVTTYEHLQMHVKHGLNGLTQSQNDWAIRAIRERLKEQADQGYKIK